VIIDSSALVAIMFAESDAAIYATAIRAARERSISAVNYVETAVVVDGRRDPVISRRFDDLLREASIIIEPFDDKPGACRSRSLPRFR